MLLFMDYYHEQSILLERKSYVTEDEKCSNDIKVDIDGYH